MTRLKFEFELDGLLKDGTITIDELVYCLWDNPVLVAANISVESLEQLEKLIKFCREG